MILLALALILPGHPGPPPKAKAAGTEVKVEDRSITLPPLPLTGSQGRTGFKEIHAQIRAAMEDLNLSLQALYGRPEASQALAADLSVPPELAEEGVVLVGVIDDPQYARLERAYLDTWKGWQAALVEGGLAKPVQASPKAPEPRSRQYEDAKKKGLLALQAPSRRLQHVTRLDAGWRSKDEEDNFSDAHFGGAPKQPEERAIPLTEVTKKENDAQNRMAVTDLLLPDLSGTWNPLVDLLNERALRVLDQERASEVLSDPAMNTVRIHARIALMERFRKALWYCDLVWCQLATVEPPPPPPRLARRKPGPSSHPGSSE
ncbi:hypothetical protein [Geothrix fuzhouensis]|uniref:hypothetical protein n=1 Tax=Geothrix fuzhouensis TaxID=2966451 RepID=UPI002147B304|nr:hypothetical protein [Geothrix fuzhouensis]